MNLALPLLSVNNLRPLTYELYSPAMAGLAVVTR